MQIFDWQFSAPMGSYWSKIFDKLMGCYSLMSVLCNSFMDEIMNV